jgi:septal ring factor EnvC (AmiA/AmiB activator)
VRRCRLGWLLLLPALAAGAATDERPGNLKRRHEDLRNRIQEAKRAVAESERSHSNALEQLRDIETGISTANRQLLSLAEQQRAVGNQLASLQHHAQELRANGKVRQEQLAALLRQKAMAEVGRADPLPWAGDDPTRAAFDRHLLTLLSRAEATLIAELRRQAAEQERLADEVRGKADELAKVEAAVQQSRNDLRQRQANRQTLLTKSRAELEGRRKELGALERDERQLGKLIASLPSRRPARSTQRPPTPQPEASGRADNKPPASAPTLPNGGAFAALKGRLPPPVAGRLRSRFGTARPDGGPAWKGLFFQAAEGSEVRAVAAGEVVYADWLRGFGNLLVVDHGEGFLSVYGNNQSLLRQDGEPVKAGEVIATAGASGGNPESGLYFELRYQGRPFDPYGWLRMQR